MDAAYRHLRAHKVRHASSGPQRLPDWNKNAGGIQAFYFKDSDGHALEVLSFPPDKGAAKWHQASDRLFLGIDHTAIVISDTEASTKFYQNVLGLRIAGESEKANDVVHWQTKFRMPSADETAQSLRRLRSSLISAGVVVTPDGNKSILARDPDGHAVQVVEQ